MTRVLVVDDEPQILRALKIPDGETPDVQAGAVSSQARAAAQSRWSKSYGSA